MLWQCDNLVIRQLLQVFSDVIGRQLDFTEWLKHYRTWRWFMQNGRAAIHICVKTSRVPGPLATVLEAEVTRTWMGRDHGKLTPEAVFVCLHGAEWQKSEATTDERMDCLMPTKWWFVRLVLIVIKQSKRHLLYPALVSIWRLLNDMEYL